MTREEAITILDTLWSNPLFNDSHKEALKLGTQALRHQEQNVVAVVPCGDAISREDTLKAMIEKLGISGEKYLYPAEATLYKVVKNMPSVTPQPKIGKWIDVFDVFGGYECCSECGCMDSCDSDYCPNCGAKMGGEQNGFH